MCLTPCCKTRCKINVAKLDKGDEFCYNDCMTTPEQRKRLLKAKIAVAIQDETGQVPTKEKIEEVFFLAPRVTYKAVLGTHYKRKEQKKQGQLAIF